MGADSSKKIVGGIIELVDPDSSGSLDKQEYEQLVHYLEADPTLKEMLPDFKTIDLNNDGQLCVSELCSHFRKSGMGEDTLSTMKRLVVAALDQSYLDDDYASDDSKDSGPGPSDSKDKSARTTDSKTETNEEQKQATKTSNPNLSSLPQDEENSGMVWHAELVSDAYRHPKHTTKDGVLKPRRPKPQVRASRFFPCLQREPNGRWIYPGMLNAWPGLRNLQVLSVTYKQAGSWSVVRHWDYRKTPNTKPNLPKNIIDANKISMRVKLMAPEWSSKGWESDNPGYFFWFHAMEDKPWMGFGESMIPSLLSRLEKAKQNVPKAVRVHHIVHRYPGKKRGANLYRESVKDKLVYHAGVLIEWDHGKYCSMVELGWLNGLGGYGGKSNWILDKNSKRPGLYRAMPGSMKKPWRAECAELRATDIGVKDLKEFKDFLRKYEGAGLRFLVPEVASSANVRVSLSDQTHIMRYCLNYIRSDGTYNELLRNCQSFAADIYGFLAGLPDGASKPYHSLCRIGFKPRRDHFLFDPK